MVYIRYTVYVRYFWQGNNQIYGHVRCICTVLADPIYVHMWNVLRIAAVIPCPIPAMHQLAGGLGTAARPPYPLPFPLPASAAAAAPPSVATCLCVSV
jgi:hypothetical protein